MMNKGEAVSIAQQYLADQESTAQVIADLTREEDFGWICFYQSKAFLETGNPDDALLGNAPLIVDRLTGMVHPTGTGLPIEFFIAVYQKYVDDIRTGKLNYAALIRSKAAGYLATGQL